MVCGISLMAKELEADHYGGGKLIGIERVFTYIHTYLYLHIHTDTNN